MPLGSDKEQRSDFQLISGTNRDLREAVVQGRFRDDLLARLEVWSFVLPGLKERLEDLEALLEQELRLRGEQLGRRLSISREGRERWLQAGRSPEALWKGNLRDLGASVLRMGTLAPAGRIDLPTVEAELLRLKQRWAPSHPDPLQKLLSVEQCAELDRFDRVQLEEVIRVCQQCHSLSEAGRLLFAASRTQKASTNDADRLKKYLSKFGLTFEQIQHRS
jgi:transcriptional regulatory protein RtcR